jgi:hypothetical protein
MNVLQLRRRKMKNDPLKKEEKTEQPAPAEGESLDSTRLLFKNAPKVPGVDTGVFFRKVFKKKDKPAKEE